MSPLVIGALVLAAAILVAYGFMSGSSKERDAVKRRLAGGRGKDEAAELKEQARESASEDLARRAMPMLSKITLPTSDVEQTNLRAKLASAGLRKPQAQAIFLASKTIVAVALALTTLLGGWAYGLTGMMLAGSVLCAAPIGFLFPDIWLMLATSTRKEAIRHGLPDTLDLMVVSVESGLALDAAIQRVGEEMQSVHPELSEELRIATAEAQMGLPRAEALTRMANRTAVSEVQSLVSIILQAEKFGTSVARALRNQADALRVKRRQKAEERAQQTAVKLMIPLVIFIFPAMGVVLGGPAMLKMMEALKDNPALG
ncbi:MAG: type II secretion system F family protein [Planctomycetes bacterium]|nr:type II secretion system F family protein [Planctomycetota bacterium]